VCLLRGTKWVFVDGFIFVFKMLIISQYLLSAANSNPILPSLKQAGNRAALVQTSPQIQDSSTDTRPQAIKADQYTTDCPLTADDTRVANTHRSPVSPEGSDTAAVYLN
jgi:hypothetical protein